jgi:hypothetical protein
MPRRLGMRYEYTPSDKYTDLAAEVVRERADLHWISDEGVRIGYLESTAPKKAHGRPVLGDCYKVLDRVRPFVPYDFLITVYAPNVDGLPVDRLRLLLYHELLHVGMEQTKDGPRYFIVPHDIEDFHALTDAYGTGWARQEA